MQTRYFSVQTPCYQLLAKPQHTKKRTHNAIFFKLVIIVGSYQITNPKTIHDFLHMTHGLFLLFVFLITHKHLVFYVRCLSMDVGLKIFSFFWVICPSGIWRCDLRPCARAFFQISQFFCLGGLGETFCRKADVACGGDLA